MRKNSPLNALETVLSQNLILERALARYDISITKHKNGTISFGGEDKNAGFLLDILLVFDDPSSFDEQTFLKYPLEVILEYLQFTHDYYLNKMLPQIGMHLLQLENGEEKQQQLYWGLIRKLFNHWEKHLRLHIQQEETTLFPYVESLIHHLKLDESQKGSYSVNAFEMHHDDDDIESALTDIRDYIEQSVGDIRYIHKMVLINQIKMFEKDLFIHGLIEDKVFVSKIKELESQI